MANTPEHPTTHADYDAHAMRAFREGLEQSLRAPSETDYMVTRSRAKLVHPVQQEEPLVLAFFQGK